jgi:16S rRNA (guanine1207-N2)-methyltransferase
MTPGRRAPDWRDEAAADLLVRHLPGIGAAGPVLIMGEARPEVPEAFSARGLEVFQWVRRAVGGRRATPWPPEGPFRMVALRLPRAKEELEMALHGAASVMETEARIAVYGAKDEGIGSAAARMEPLFRNPATVGVGGHCRVLTGTRREALPGLRRTLSHWRRVDRFRYGGVERGWVSYPGLFARGRLDPGTRLLLDALPELRPGARVLDYGCGSGLVGAVVQHRYPLVRLDLMDIDAVALEAAAENVPGAGLLLGDGLPPPGREAYEAVISNPPFHRGKAEDPGLIGDLVRGAPSVLGPGGCLVLVAQRRLKLEETFRQAFGRVNVRAEDRGFRVWEGRDPTWAKKSQ